MDSSDERGEPWFQDGNIILVTDSKPSTAFRVHQGVLGRHSEVFQGMFSIPQPVHGSDEEVHGGCQVVRMYDIPADLSSLITALYDGPAFRDRHPHDFGYLSGILRLSTKYFISHLRAQAIQFLVKIWPHTLEGHDAMVAKALVTPSSDGLTYPYVHPLRVLNLAHETNIRIVAPSAFYFLSLYPLDDITRGDHPKLLVEHPSYPSSTLRPGDIEAYTLMFQYRLKVILDFIRREPPLVLNCTSGGVVSCTRGFQRHASRLFRSWQTRTGPLYFLLQAINAIDDEPHLCEACRTWYRKDAHELRSKIWDELPSIIGLPRWGDLVAIELSE